jgi:HSP20 family molecular chaperone IbpA
VGERDNPTDAFPSKFERSFQVAKELDVAHVSASLENGLLEITIPKPTVETNGPIEIKVN